MSGYATDEMVEVAARASWEAGREPNHPTWDDLGEGLTRAAFRKENRAALEAAAPLIAAQALRDAADGMDLSAHYPSPGLSEMHNAEAAAEAYLRARATAVFEEDTTDE